MNWTHLTSGRPCRDGLNWLELCSPLKDKRVAVERDALASLILDAPGLEHVRDSLVRHGLLEDTHQEDSLARRDIRMAIRHWQERGWSSGIDWYLWSRRHTFTDDGANPNLARRSTMVEYLKVAPCPTPPQAQQRTRSLTSLSSSSPLGATLMARRSQGEFVARSITLEQLSHVLTVGTSRMRAARSSISSDPLNLLSSHGCAFDVHVLVYDVTGLRAGRYFFEPERQLLETRRLGRFCERANDIFGGQPDQQFASALVLLAASFERYHWRYRHERALRNLYVDAGRVMNRLALSATSLGLQTGLTPLLRDSDARALLGLADEDAAVVHSLTLGGCLRQPAAMNPTDCPST